MHVHWDLKHQLLDALYSAGFDNSQLILLRTSGQVTQRRDGMTLDLFVVLERQQVDQGLQETRLDDRGLVLRMNRDIAHTSRSGEDEGKVGGLEQTEKGSQTIGLNNLQLVLLYRKSSDEWARE